MAKKEEAAAGGATVETANVSLLDSIILEGKMVRDDSQREYAKDLIGEFVSQVLDQGMVIGADTVAMINDRVAQIDKLLSDQLNEIVHAQEFQRLEATWRGMKYFVFNSETGPRMKLRVMNVTKTELLNDLEKAVEFDQSATFKKIYEEEYGTDRKSVV